MTAKCEVWNKKVLGGGFWRQIPWQDFVGVLPGIIGGTGDFVCVSQSLVSAAGIFV